MRVVKQQTKRAVYRVRDKVRTALGEGVVKYVFPHGPGGKTAYSVRFDKKRVGVIFDEDEITLIARY